MTRISDLEATMEQYKAEVAATMAANTKRLDQMQEMIEKNKAEADKQHAEVLRLLKALQPPTTTAAASHSIPQPPSTFTPTNPLPPPRHTTLMLPPTHPLSQPIVVEPPTDANLILNQKPTKGIPNLCKELHVTLSKFDSYGDTQLNPSGSSLEIVSGRRTSPDKKVVQGKVTNFSHGNLVVTTSIRERGEWLANGHLKLPSSLLPPSLSLLLLPPPLPPPLPPLTIIDVNCCNQFQFDLFPP